MVHFESSSLCVGVRYIGAELNIDAPIGTKAVGTGGHYAEFLTSALTHTELRDCLLQTRLDHGTTVQETDEGCRRSYA
jgi:hypothetical protein